MEQKIKCEENGAGYTEELGMKNLTVAPNKPNEWSFSGQKQALLIIFQRNRDVPMINLIDRSLYSQEWSVHKYKYGYGDLP